MDSSPSKRRRTSPSTSIAVTVENTNLESLPQDGASSDRRQSSFMSPTKASLARFHPSLLPRAKSAEAPRPVNVEIHGSIEQDSATSGRTNGADVYIAGTASGQFELGINGVEKSHGLPVAPRPKSTSPGDGSARAKRGLSVTSPVARVPLPEAARPKGTKDDGTNGGQQQPVAEIAGIENSGITFVPDSQSSQLPSTPKQCEPHVPTSGMGIGEDGEPSLPSTPSQLGLEPLWEKSKGLLFSSPIRRSRRKRRSSAKSSPLKSLDPLPKTSNQRQKSSIADFGPRRYIENTPIPPPPKEEVFLTELQNRLNNLESQLQDIEVKLLQQILASSWQRHGGKEGGYKAQQRKEVIQRSTRIVQLRDEVRQIRTAQSIEAIPVAATKPSILTQRLAKFLPFAIVSRSSEPTSPSPKTNDVNHTLDLDTMRTAVTPFTITISNASLLPTTADNDLLQRQDVCLSTPQQSLKCDLQLTTNINAHQIATLETQALSSWAEPELGSWLRRPREEMEVATLGRVFGRYWEVAKLRGKCWISCKQEFTNLVANAPESNSPLWYLGLQDLIFARSNVQLKLTWRISLSDQGEVESHSSAYPRFPAAWQQEANSELTKVGDAFMMLVEDRGIPEAIGTICKVVFPT